ncbi:MAG: TIGR03668 family PPOX class F420-dependent oxidoreductase [Acidobacteria bacterium]|nr:TIGR03668 family PPOX class F420-dependent oxidoreductase [Acidobacteriota bacterium]
MARSSALTQKEKDFISAGRVAHLATTDARGRPLVVPICYAFHGIDLYSSIDEKPKKVSPLLLERIRNIRENPYVSIVVDRYEEDWSRLAYVLIRGRARILTPGPRHKKAVDLLQRKYPQYREMAIDKRPIIHITLDRAKSWGVL